MNTKTTRIRRSLPGGLRSLCRLVADASPRYLFTAAFGWQRSIFAVLVVGVVTSGAIQAQESSVTVEPRKATISAEAATIFERVQEMAAVDFENAVAAFVVRRFNHTPDGHNQQQLATAREALEKAKAIRIENEKRLGRKVDVAALDDEIEANLLEMKSQLETEDLQTFAEKYYLQGQAYRMEQMALPDNADLQALCDDLAAGRIEFRPSYIRTWNGTEYAEIVDRQPADAATAGHPSTFSTLGYEDQGALPRFAAFGRDGVGKSTFLQDAADKGFAATVRSIATDDQRAIVLSVGHPKSLSMYFEATILPTMGYSVASSFTKVRGQIVSRESFDDFVHMSAGFWLPTRIVREAYKLDDDQVPYLSSKEELLAYDPPKTNVSLAKDTFSLASTEEWKSLPLSTHLLPEKSPLVESQALERSDDTSKTLLVLANIVVVAGLALIIYFRRRNTSSAY